MDWFLEDIAAPIDKYGYELVTAFMTGYK